MVINPNLPQHMHCAWSLICVIVATSTHFLATTPTAGCPNCPGQGVLNCCTLMLLLWPLAPRPSFLLMIVVDPNNSVFSSAYYLVLRIRRLSQHWSNFFLAGQTPKSHISRGEKTKKKLESSAWNFLVEIQQSWLVHLKTGKRLARVEEKEPWERNREPIEKATWKLPTFCPYFCSSQLLLILDASSWLLSLIWKKLFVSQRHVIGSQETRKTSLSRASYYTHTADNIKN